MCIEFLDRYEGILPNLPRSYGRVCCICGRDTTYSREGTPVWYRYKDENGNHTGEWTCHNCNGKRKGYKFKILKCRICGSGDTRILSNGKPIWIRDFDIDQEFTGEYLCYKCHYHADKKCYKCGKTGRINKEYINERWTGKFICRNCRFVHDAVYCSFCNKEISRSYYQKLDDTDNPTGKIFCGKCLPKISADCRNKNLDPDSVAGIGYMTEALVAKFLDIKTCFDLTGKFNHRTFDMYEHDDYGKIDVKGSSFTGNSWCLHINRNKKCDFFFCICYDKDRKHIIRVYIFPNEEYISGNVQLYINLDDIDYDFFREDEKPWDDLFHTLKLGDCPVLRNR